MHEAVPGHSEAEVPGFLARDEVTDGRGDGHARTDAGGDLLDLLADIGPPAEQDLGIGDHGVGGTGVVDHLDEVVAVQLVVRRELLAVGVDRPGRFDAAEYGVIGGDDDLARHLFARSDHPREKRP
ncbi:hypothetical protein RB200_35885 [Streptomyces sp. PmtG]